MSFTYDGDPSAAQAPAPIPSEDVDPQLVLPSDGDAADVASIEQAFKELADFIAYRQRNKASQDIARGSSIGFLGGANPTTATAMLLGSAAPISGLDVLPSFDAATAFDVEIGAGKGSLYAPSGIPAGMSDYREIAWDLQDLTIGTPHATLPRVDAIAVTPAAFGSPSTLSVVAGTAASPPMPPAVASGTGHLFYVYVPAAAPTSATFKACRGLWRRTSYPFAGVSGVLAGMRVYWSQVDPATTSAAPVVTGIGAGGLPELQRVVIDGEVIEFMGSFGNANVVNDAANDPSATAAISSTVDRPFYLYAVGGRHNPMPNLSPGGAASINPVIIALSTVAPNIATGKPTAAMTVRGVAGIQDGAVYIGLGSIVKNTTGRFRSMVVMGDMTVSGNEALEIPFAALAGGLAGTALSALAGKPAFATKIAASLGVTPASTANNRLVQVLSHNAATALVGAPLGQVQIVKGSDNASFAQVMLALPPAGTIFYGYSANAGDTLAIYVAGYNQSVNRFDGLAGG